MLTTSGEWKMGGAQNLPSLTWVHIKSRKWMNRMIKKAALGGPSSDDTYPLREKTKF